MKILCLLFILFAAMVSSIFAQCKSCDNQTNATVILDSSYVRVVQFKRNGPLTVYLENIPNTKENIFNVLDEYKEEIVFLQVAMFDMKTLDLSPLSEYKKLSILNIHHSFLSKLDLTPLSECKSLKQFEIKGSKLKDLDLNPLGKCDSLQRIFIYNVPIRDIVMDSLVYCKQMDEFHISSTYIDSIQFDVMNKWVVLRQLNLSQNRLEYANLEPLKNCKIITGLNLSLNPIKTIDLHPLENLLQLRTLNLDGCELEIVELSPLKRHRNLVSLSISPFYVDLKHIQNCTGLVHLSLGNNLKTLDLSPIKDFGKITDFRIGKGYLSEQEQQSVCNFINTHFSLQNIDTDIICNPIRH